MFRTFLLLALIGPLVACGFHTRGDLPANIKDKPIAIIGNTQGAGGSGTAIASNIDAQLKAQIVKNGGTVAAKVADAAVVINIVRARHIRRPITLSAVGRANMYDLNYVVIYQVQDGQGHLLSKQRELAIRREYFNTQASPLGQGLEEAQYRQEMEQEASLSLMRQIVLILEHPDNVTPDDEAKPKPLGPGAVESAATKP
jgi:outer membrane lipopolysaccharide assembly protein LptE/RlpB